MILAWNSAQVSVSHAISSVLSVTGQGQHLDPVAVRVANMLCDGHSVWSNVIQSQVNLIFIGILTIIVK